MQGGNNGSNPDFANFNIRTVGGSVNGWHSGALQTMAEPLIMFDVLTGEYENWLAESWQYNADSTELTVKLRDGIEWSDGTPFTSEDVVYTLNTVRDNQDKMVHTAEINFLKEAQAVDDSDNQVRAQQAESALVGDDADQQPRHRRAVLASERSAKTRTR